MSKVLVEVKKEIRSAKRWQASINAKRLVEGIRGVSYHDPKRQFVDMIQKHILPSANEKVITVDGQKPFTATTLKDLTPKGIEMVFDLSYDNSTKAGKERSKKSSDKVDFKTAYNWLQLATIKKFVKGV